MHSVSVLRISSILIILLVVASLFHVVVASAQIGIDEDGTASALGNAEEALVLGYQAVLKTEQSGANVSSLLVRLNGAGELLTQAHMEYRLGNFGEAISLANSSRSIGEEVQNRAMELKDLAWSQTVQRMLFTMMASVVGAAVVASGSLWVWFVLKKRYSNGKTLPKVN